MQVSPVFISYSHKNKRELEMLRTHLKYLEEKYVLNVWDDQSIQPGMKWREEIERARQAAKVAVLLVSAEFLASEFIAQQELPVLLKAAESGTLTLISVVLSTCLFDETPLTKFQAFEKPLNGMTKAKREATLGQVAKRVAAALLQANAPQAPTNP